MSENLVENAKGKSPIEMFYHWEKETPTTVYLRQPIDNVWHDYTWADVSYRVRRLTTALYAQGLQRGDKVAILSKNCAEWIVTDLALQLGGFVSVPMYFDLTADSMRYVLEHSESKALFVGKLDQPVWDRLKGAVPESVMQIAFSDHGKDGDFDRSDFDLKLMELVESNEPFSESPIPDDEDIWTIVYTSGTTGYPKGAVHCYRAPRFVGHRAIRVFGLSREERGLSFLPLAHVAERLLVATASIYCSGQINFIQSLATFQRDITTVQPTIFFSVPRLWKKFQGGILDKLPQEKLDRLLRIPLVRRLVAKKLREKLGLGKARMVVSGAAPISPSLLAWYDKLGVEILEGYGMTENFAYGCIGRPGRNKLGTVGLPMDGCGFKLSDDGEILFKSPTVMKEYYKQPDETAASMTEDGYYRSGDLGTVDEDGFVSITGRVKEIFKTEKGEYVAPAPIESKASSFKEFEQICLGGIGLAQPVMVVTLSEQGHARCKYELSAEIIDHLNVLNADLLNHEKIAGVVVATEDWLPEGGLVTPTLKIKRNKVEERYMPLMAELTERGVTILWEKDGHVL
ncbi:MAG: long-chain fatty acid--CoA ligase [Gammaproteobacteria bacterium]|nr:MAG: long-chain fatty acid--CoA ligase [Gammaproteobacteria bacterium]